jgi:hypothetical protein
MPCRAGYKNGWKGWLGYYKGFVVFYKKRYVKWRNGLEKQIYVFIFFVKNSPYGLFINIKGVEHERDKIY